MQVKSPAETIDAAIASGISKVETTHRSPIKLIVSAMLAGAFIAIGGILALIVGYGFPEAAQGNPSLPRLLSGAMFPIGLILVVVIGAELFTGNNATLIPAYMARRYRFSSVVRNWTIVYIGNLIGAVTFTYLFVYQTGLTESQPYHNAIIGIGTVKTSMTWQVVLLKGIAANWFVCLGVWLAMSGHNLLEKALGCWLPVMAFVALGFEHSIANMFYLPLALMEGAPITLDRCVTNNFIPATIGNIIGGALFVGTLHTYLHRKHPERQKHQNHN